jgi:hypothetical protein
MIDAAELVAIDVFEATRAAGEPITAALVKQRAAELVAHAPECGGIAPPALPQVSSLGPLPA